MTNQRLDYLDSIRGIAALTTLVGHWLHMFKPDQGMPEHTRQWLDFAVCGADRVWHWATGKIVGTNQVELTSPQVAAPVAVRYAWADNPVCNLVSADGLPVTPFRTDSFPLTTQPK